MKNLGRFYVAFTFLVLCSIVWLQTPRPIKNPQVLSVKVQLNQNIVEVDLVNHLRHIQSKRNGKLNVLIMGQWKSGSLYLAQLLTMYPKTFYIHEPVNGNTSNSEAITRIASLLKCSFPKEPTTNSSKSKSLDNCNDIRCSTTTQSDHHQENLCSRSNINVVKSIRLKSIGLEPLLESDPKLKVLVVARDPRAVWNSRSSNDTLWCGVDPDCHDLDHFCSDLSEELGRIMQLSKTYQERIKIIRYEDLVHNSGVATIRKIFDFFTDAVDEKIVNIMLKSYQKKIKAMKAQRELGLVKSWINPRQNVRKWLNNLPIEVAKNVSEKCSKTINMLGYPSRNEAIDGSMVVQSNEEVQKILT